MSGYSRRLFLQLSGAAATGALIPAHTAHPEDDSFALLRRRWCEVTAGSGFDATAEPYRTRLARLGTTAALYRDTMAPADISLWPELAFPSFVDTPARLRTMARAYALPGTGLTGDANLAAAVAGGIDHYRRQVYASGADPVGNWWNWQIGTPRKLLDAAVLIGSHLTDRRSGALRDAVDHFLPECRLNDYAGTSTGANRVDLCTVTLLRAILGSDPGKAALAASALSPVFPHVFEGDGLYRDGSFIQHTSVPYQGGYGAVMLSGLATLFEVLRGSPWEITDPDRQIVLNAVERSFAPFVHDGFCMDLVSGRGIDREPYGDHRRGRDIASAILRLGDAASAAERARWQGMVKGWAVRDTSSPMLDAAERNDLEFHARLAALLDDDAIPAAEEPAGHRLPAMSARAVHRRPAWCAGLSMASYRIGHYEHGNGENRRGWHTGSGMLYWWGEGHGDQYSDSFWPTVDPYRLPGTTVSTRRLADGAGAEWGDTCPPGRWVGGATDGTYATVGQHLFGFESTMEAFKSWFFLDDAVVCLGAGITSEDGVPVETVVDNRRTGALLTVDDREGWAHLAGHGGYVLPCPTGLRTLREERTAGQVTRSYVTLWLDHGVDPHSAGYVYLLLPGASRARTRARAADPGWARVLANTTRQQGVLVPSLGITAVNFWNDGTVGGLAASAPCAVLVRESGDGTATLTVSDPRRDLDELTATWDRPVAEVLGGHPLLVSATTGARLTLAFGRLADRGGGSQTVTVRLGRHVGRGRSPG
ncbi:polysaccharide lyase 8 family protein [Streptosporangium sp. NBC_01755]|uniref:polysaccharide lyase 8 family protein n=1 Tax=unclassified Streptosporangium TaxID=2632669 RepID=UPI002DDC0E72|nr:MULTISPECIES: polysaccharide lyase 8 family protein [unclassified Streptosporangium]WSA25376.1 polysaccharide lyase 8 family protein [Streptosporangium sp. NBC_01810]WSD03308.1 polysaccharide lyase 8 family protein [Streptosporangium sp. NBC_01755]